MAGLKVGQITSCSAILTLAGVDNESKPKVRMKVNALRENADRNLSETLTAMTAIGVKLRKGI